MEGDHLREASLAEQESLARSRLHLRNETSSPDKVFGAAKIKTRENPYRQTFTKTPPLHLIIPKSLINAVPSPQVTRWILLGTWQHGGEAVNFIDTRPEGVSR